ncbi:hypothetical protein [Actinoplanes sp. NPDC049118]|uniref:hypothetical protein n=1 Tax=Actinoplanes sp. NPDC049118 TaxID=3155769 RepID=UPI0033E69CF3
MSQAANAGLDLPLSSDVVGQVLDGAHQHGGRFRREWPQCSRYGPAAQRQRRDRYRKPADAPQLVEFVQPAFRPEPEEQQKGSEADSPARNYEPPSPRLRLKAVRHDAILAGRYRHNLVRVTDRHLGRGFRHGKSGEPTT